MSIYKHIRDNEDVLTKLMGNNNLNEIIFPIDCSKCHIYPIKNIIYKCTECMLFYCENCEKTEGIKHEHALYKIRTIFKPLFKENLNNEKTYDFSIVNKDLDDSINLIIGAMTEYVPIPVLIEIVSNKCKEAGLKEYAQMIRQMFLSYDIRNLMIIFS